MTSAPAEFLEPRRVALSRSLAAEGLDALVVTSRANIAYLSGFFGSAGLLLATGERLQLFSDSRYAEALDGLARRLPSLEVVTAPPGRGSAEESLVEAVASLRPSRLGFESAHLTVRQHVDLKARLASTGSRAELTPTEGMVEQLRARKDAWEVEKLREAGRRLSDVAKCIIPKVLAGSSERQLAARIEWELRQKGFDKPAFDTIVASGPNAALPHHRAGARVLEEGDLVVIDFGGMLDGYAVDMTRTVTLGPATRRQRECLMAVAAAQRAAFAAARVGVDAEDVDAAARVALAAAGLAEAFGHGLGHGLGLEVHERPRLSRRRPGASEGPLAAGMVFTLEPGVYFPGWGGVRLEDDVLATDAGPEWLTEPVVEVRAT
ncbi:MAG: M24 family metallopeptidase [Vicinamibacterales bacterium]